MLGRLALSLSLILPACVDHDVTPIGIVQSIEQRKQIPVSINWKIDILFVIDDSQSMAQEQRSLANNFSRFVDVFESIEGGLPDVHIGVISTNVGTGLTGGGGPACDGVGDNGILQVPGHCPPLTDGKRYISNVRANYEGSQRELNYTGTLEEQFGCMAELGTGGCGFEQPLEAVRRALDNDRENAGFLRPNAFLAVIILSDEDDCSARNPSIFDPTQDSVDDPLGEMSSYRCFEFGTICDGVDPGDERTPGARRGCEADEESPYLEPVSEYAEFLKGLKPDPSKVIVATVTARDRPVRVGVDPEKDEIWVEPACVVCPETGPADLGDCSLDPAAEGSALVAATPAIRLRAFLDEFPQRATAQDICAYNEYTGDVDFSGALTQIALRLHHDFWGLPCIEDVLTDPPECEVSDVVGLNLPDQHETQIPPCSESGPPCYDLVDAPDCQVGSNVAIDIDRGETEPADDTTVVVRCLVE